MKLDEIREIRWKYHSWNSVSELTYIRLYLSTVSPERQSYSKVNEKYSFKSSSITGLNILWFQDCPNDCMRSSVFLFTH